MKTDIYERITSQIVAELEIGVRPRLKPWNAEHAAGRITRLLRYNAVPYQAINVITLWSAAVANGYAAPLWMTYRTLAQTGGNLPGQVTTARTACSGAGSLPGYEGA